MLLNDFCCGLRTRARLGDWGRGGVKGRRWGVGCSGSGAKVMRGSAGVGWGGGVGWGYFGWLGLRAGVVFGLMKE